MTKEKRLYDALSELKHAMTEIGVARFSIVTSDKEHHREIWQSDLGGSHAEPPHQFHYCGISFETTTEVKEQVALEKKAMIESLFYGLIYEADYSAEYLKKILDDF
ncbi:hypothetical protein MXMO3_01696 [Maritalea myrionectae]|uniref:Uncharacterized protein n=1 Tax=Maritalea myrionectae TaxID=454601 RepID=A0A2R4MDY4_9HYPH|nr:hypothetical protein [Maritalea myrionectae]AVX04222.1 hypothetical protein MXMO3_01696 [Maritalea myrionectae]